MFHPLLIFVVVAALLIFGMLGMIRKPLRHDRDRRKLDPSQIPQPTPIGATVTSTGGSNVSIAFDQPVVVKGLFGIRVGGDLCASQVVVDQQHITLVASADVAENDWVIPANDPNIRNSTGGFVAPAAATF